MHWESTIQGSNWEENSRQIMVASLGFSEIWGQERLDRLEERGVVLNMYNFIPCYHARWLDFKLVSI